MCTVLYGTVKMCIACLQTLNAGRFVLYTLNETVRSFAAMYYTINKHALTKKIHAQAQYNLLRSDTDFLCECMFVNQNPFAVAHINKSIELVIAFDCRIS